MNSIKNTLNFRHMFGGLVLGAIVTCGASAQTPVTLPDDTPTMVGGIDAACTGIAMQPEDMPRWNAYPLKIIAVGSGGQFMADEQVTVSQGGHELVNVICGGPWVLLRLAPGEYEVNGSLEGKTAQAKAHVPKSGQGVVALHFPALGGAVSPQDAAAKH